MRTSLFALVLLVACGDPDLDVPAASAPFQFTLVPTNAPAAMLSRGVDLEYEFRGHGMCKHGHATGGRFMPREGGKAKVEALGNQSASIMLADIEDITVALAVRGAGGILIASGCARASLHAGNITVIELPLVAAGRE